MKIQEVLQENKITNPFDLLSDEDLLSLGKALNTTMSENNQDPIEQALSKLNTKQRLKVRQELSKEIIKRQKMRQQFAVSPEEKERRKQNYQKKKKSSLFWNKIIMAIILGTTGYIASVLNA